MPGFNTLGDLTEPYPGDLQEAPGSSWDELNKLLKEHQALGPQPDLEDPANAPRTKPEDNRPFPQRLPDIRGPGITGDQNNSTWMPRELEGVPRNGIPTWAMPGEAPSSPPVGPPQPGMEDRPPPPGERPTEQPTPQYEGTALQRYQAPGGASYTTDDSVGARFQAFFQALKDRYGFEPKDVQGYNPRNIAGTSTPSNHWAKEGRGAVDIDPDAHPQGARGTWGNIPIAAVAREFGLKSGAEFRSRPDEMHVEATRASMLGSSPPQQSGGTTKMASVGDLVDPNTGEPYGVTAPPVERAPRARAVEGADAGRGSSQPTPASSWQEFASGPMRQSFALNFGLQAMMPSYYGVGGQIAQALGAGFEGASQTGANIQKQLASEQSADEKAAENEATRQSREDIARIQSDSRAEVANIRGQFGIQRALIGLQKAPASTYLKYMDLARKSIENNIGNLSMDDATKTELIKSKAAELYQAAVDMGMESQGANSSGAQNSATGTPGAQSSGGTPGPKNSSGNAGNSANQMTWEQIVSNPKMMEAMQDPTWREKLFAKRPELRARWASDYGSSAVAPERYR